MADTIFVFGVALEIWALTISIIAILFTLLKDFILPFFFKPKFIFEYHEDVPYRREDIRINNDRNRIGTFLRFKVKNIGNRPANNCRCQLSRVEDIDNHRSYGDYQGFPLRWASRPESIIDQIKGERLNIGIGETEFIDLAFTGNDRIGIVLEKYHNVPIGIKETIPPGNYYLYLIFSGDNFKPYELKFHINRYDNNDPEQINVGLEEIKQL
jgi:hypothetical protein